jgi:DNA-damage-inducible protein D
MTNELKEYKERVFDDIKHIDENGGEYWEARELMNVLKYTEWRNFKQVIDKAMISCKASNFSTSYHFVDFNKMISLGKGAKRETNDYHLSRYACYLIVQNADPKKENVALGQTYFAVQIRKMELNEEEYAKLTEDEKRLYRRKQTKDGKILNK